MKTIWKFPVHGEHAHGVIEAPGLTRILHFGMQNGGYFCWGIVDTDAPLARLDVVFTGTGQSIPACWGYVNTFFDGPFVWHGWVRREEPHA